MSGRIVTPSNKYVSIDETLTFLDGRQSRPFQVTRLLDTIINDGPGMAVISLDEGADIPMEPGFYVGPWPDFSCSTIYIQCVEEGKSCRIRGLGV